MSLEVIVVVRFFILIIFLVRIVNQWFRLVGLIMSSLICIGYHYQVLEFLGVI